MTKSGFDFRPQSPLKRSHFRTEQYIGNLKQALERR